jgi:hypothetical protein
LFHFKKPGVQWCVPYKYALCGGKPFILVLYH